MHFHLPKPLHGWREFIGEVGIIVVGVLIALGAEQLVEQWHWRNQTRAAGEAFKEELLDAAAVSLERIAIQPCLQGRIKELATQLNEDGTYWTASPMPMRDNRYGNVLPVVYRAPSRTLPTDAWRSALADGTVDHIASDRVRQLSSLYSLIARFDGFQSEEARAAAELTPLGYDRRIDDQTKVHMLAALAEVDRINSLMALQAEQVIPAIRAMKLHFGRTSVAKARSQLLNSQVHHRGQCVQTPPLSLD